LPPPLGGGGGNVGLGREIFANGLPESNVPACSACHGPDARGTGQIPRLAGQLPSYLVNTLSGWSRNRSRESAGGLSAVMVPTTHNLTPAMMSAVAAYVSALR
jgi:cytochrome c553